MVEHAKFSSILAPGNPNEPLAYVGINDGRDSFGLHAAGYFDAALQLLNNIMANRGKVDLVIYPALYLFRHGVELSLKQLERYFREMYGSRQRGPKPKEKGHPLAARWARVKGELQCLIDFAGPSEFPGKISVAEVDQVIADLDRIDADGVTFRYPESLEGKSHLAGVQYIGIPNVLRVVERTALAFGNWRYHISEQATFARREREGRSPSSEGV